MSLRLAHRGPDDRGALVMGPGGEVRRGRDIAEIAAADVAKAQVALLHRRLAILDPTSASAQPMSSADERWHLIFNGEIYNYVELRAELEALGQRFRTHGDTEVLLAAMIEWGTSALERLTGMFAFALLDAQRRELLLARDPFGIKPLYYTIWQGGLAFASEIKALLELPGVGRTADPQGVYDYLRFGTTQHRTQTLFGGILQFPDGHFARVLLDRPTEVLAKPFWRLEARNGRTISLDQAAGRLRERFVDSVRLHLRSDVPVGVALSGGIDSSAIAAGVRQVFGKDKPVHAFFYEAPGELSEKSWALSAAEGAGAEVHSCTPSAGDLAKDIDHLIALQEEPFGSLSVYAQYRVFKLAASAGVKVMLGGQGADEMLAGYRPLLAARLASLLKSGSLLKAASFLRNTARLSGASAWRTAARAVGLLIPDDLQGPLRRLAREGLVPAWMNKGWIASAGLSPKSLWRAQDDEVLRAHLREALLEKSLPALLRYEDRNCMACSIESRVPFLTPAIAEFVLSLPEEHLISADGTTKAVFRKAMHGLVPQEILARRDKIGFAACDQAWMESLNPWMEEVLSAGGDCGPIMISHVRSMWRQMQEGKRPFDLAAWRCVNLLRWSQVFNVRLQP